MQSSPPGKIGRRTGSPANRELGSSKPPDAKRSITYGAAKTSSPSAPYRAHPSHLWNERIEAVLSVIYFIFNEGYLASSGNALVRRDLSEEAIRLARIMTQLAPGENEAFGLLALMLLHDSRRFARIDENGKMIPLENQDRSLWNGEEKVGGIMAKPAEQAAAP